MPPKPDFPRRVGERVLIPDGHSRRPESGGEVKRLDRRLALGIFIAVVLSLGVVFVSFETNQHSPASEVRPKSTDDPDPGYAPTLGALPAPAPIVLPPPARYSPPPKFPAPPLPGPTDPNPAPGAVPPLAPAPEDLFKQFDDKSSQLVSEQSKWHAPEEFTVDESQMVGLQIGDSSELAADINALLPNTVSKAGPRVQVGPTMTARLVASPSDAEVAPDDTIDRSTGSDIEVLFSWSVKPKRAGKLHLTAEVDVPLDGTSQKVHTTVPLDIVVADTNAHRVKQLLSDYGPLLGLIGGGGIIGLLAWIGGFVRKRRGNQIPVPGEPVVPASDPVRQASPIQSDPLGATSQPQGTVGEGVVLQHEHPGAPGN